MQNFEGGHSQSAGHRERILKRFESGGISAFHDYEILELFLTTIIPRKDVKPIAKTLLAKYKTINAVFNAPSRELEEIDGLGKRSVLLLKFVRDMQGFCLKEEITAQKTIVNNKDDIAKYLSFNFGNLQEEYLILFLLDRQNAVISTEIAVKGCVKKCPISPRALFDRALQAKAANIILAHNHPAHSINPSLSDWKTTQKIAEIGESLEIGLIDHIIISGNKVLSLREKNEIEKVFKWNR